MTMRRRVAEQDMTDEQFIVFRLGAQDYGLPIAAVAEITKAPEQIARMPKAPAFIDGVIESARHRPADHGPAPAVRSSVGCGRRAAGAFWSVAAGGAQAGFVVDAVSEVLKVARRRHSARAGAVEGADAADRARGESAGAR